jgi:predicted transcriptional regulator
MITWRARVCWVICLHERVRRKTAMVITVSPDLEAALNEAARQQSREPEAVALDALRERFLRLAATLQPRDEWERGLLQAERDCGVSLSDAALSSEGL